MSGKLKINNDLLQNLTARPEVIQKINLLTKEVNVNHKKTMSVLKRAQKDLDRFTNIIESPVRLSPDQHEYYSNKQKKAMKAVKDIDQKYKKYIRRTERKMNDLLSQTRIAVPSKDLEAFNRHMKIYKAGKRTLRNKHKGLNKKIKTMKHKYMKHKTQKKKEKKGRKRSITYKK